MMAFATNGVHMQDNAMWEARVKGLLKAELKKRGVSYIQLVEKLAAWWTLSRTSATNWRGVNLQRCSWSNA
jgi:hypothetical protein